MTQSQPQLQPVPEQPQAPQITTDDLLMIIGQKEVQIAALQGQLQRMNRMVESQAQHIRQMLAEAAPAPTSDEVETAPEDADTVQ